MRAGLSSSGNVNYVCTTAPKAAVVLLTIGTAMPFGITFDEQQAHNNAPSGFR